MIMSFRVSELQLLLGFAGRNKHGKKHELQARAIDLTRIQSQTMRAKIRELYKASQEAQQQQMNMIYLEEMYEIEEADIESKPGYAWFPISDL